MMKLRMLVPSFLCFAALAAAQNPFQWSGHIVAGKTLEVRGINGWIHAEPSAGDAVEIVANKHGQRSDPNSVRVEVVPQEGGITVCAVYPTPEGSEHPNECAPSGGHMNTKDNDVRVDFTVKVPAGAVFKARTVNGAIEANALRGEADLSTVNGSIKGSTSGNMRAKTVNGSITASMADSNWAGDRTFETVNGTIEVQLPAQASTELSASTVNGAIRSDFSISTTRVSRRRLEGTIGSGGRKLNLKTVNGDVTVKRG